MQVLCRARSSVRGCFLNGGAERAVCPNVAVPDVTEDWELMTGDSNPASSHEILTRKENMSLMQKHSMTDKNRAAHQRNGRQSRGAATAEGQERNRAAHLKHGFYSRQREEALRALGEDPAELAALIESAHEDWRPANDFQARIAERLARLLWRMERAERIQESLATQPVERHEKHRQAVAEALRREATPQVDILYTLGQDAADARYYTPRGFFRDFCEAFGKRVKETAEKEILLLMHRLRKPPDLAAEPGAKTRAEPGKVTAGTGTGLSPSVGLNGARPERTLEPGGARLWGNTVRHWRRGVPGGRGGRGRPPRWLAWRPPKEDVYLSEMADYDDDDFPVPWPDVEVAEGRERDDLRVELVDKAKSLLKVIQAALEEALEEQEAPLSRLERDGLQATAASARGVDAAGGGVVLPAVRAPGELLDETPESRGEARRKCRFIRVC